MKRLFDIIFSFFGLVVLTPILIIVSFLVRITSRGSVFFVQKRVGLRGKEFNLFKFRTMFSNSDRKGLLTVGERDTRITSIGYYLRKYKIDELPQLINVLNGSMSIVGPRPEVRKYVNYYTKEQLEILKIKPGITDWASIIYRNENVILNNSVDPERDYINIILQNQIKLNFIYLNKKSIYEYFRIIFFTLVVIIFPKLDVQKLSNI